MTPKRCMHCPFESQHQMQRTMEMKFQYGSLGASDDSIDNKQRHFGYRTNNGQTFIDHSESVTLPLFIVTIYMIVFGVKRSCFLGRLRRWQT